MTRKRELLPSDGGGGQRGSRPPQHAAPQALRFKARPARSCLRQRGEAASIASRAGAGEGSTGRRAGRLAEAARAEAERTPPGRPARGHLGRCGDRPSGTTRGDDGGRPGAPWGGRLRLFLRPPGAGLAALSIGARRRQLLRAGPARLARRGSLRSPAEPRPRARASGHPAPALERLRTSALRFQPSASRRAWEGSSALSPRCRWDACLLAAPSEPREAAAPRLLNSFFFPCGLWSLVLA